MANLYSIIFTRYAFLVYLYKTKYNDLKNRE